MVTHDAAKAMGIADGYGVGVGRRADLVVLDTQAVADVLLDLPPRRHVIRRGRIVAETRTETTVHRRGIGVRRWQD